MSLLRDIALGVGAAALLARLRGSGGGGGGGSGGGGSGGGGGGPVPCTARLTLRGSGLARAAQRIAFCRDHPECCVGNSPRPGVTDFEPVPQRDCRVAPPVTMSDAAGTRLGDKMRAALRPIGEHVGKAIADTTFSDADRLNTSGGLIEAGSEIRMTKALAKALLPDFYAQDVWLAERERCMLANGYAVRDGQNILVLEPAGLGPCDPLSNYRAAPTGRGPATKAAVFRTLYWNPDQTSPPWPAHVPSGDWCAKALTWTSPTRWIPAPATLLRYYTARALALRLAPRLAYRVHAQNDAQVAGALRWLDEQVATPVAEGIADQMLPTTRISRGGGSRATIRNAVRNSLMASYQRSVLVDYPPDSPWYQDVGEFFKDNAPLMIAVAASLVTANPGPLIVYAGRFAMSRATALLREHGVNVSADGFAATIGGADVALGVDGDLSIVTNEGGITMTAGGDVTVFSAAAEAAEAEVAAAAEAAEAAVAAAAEAAAAAAAGAGIEGCFSAAPGPSVLSLGRLASGR